MEYVADSARDAAVGRLTTGSKLTVDNAETRDDWESLRTRLESQTGVVHVLFSGAIGSAVLPRRDVRGFALALNLDREAVFSLACKQIWWLPQPLVLLLRPWAPDFLSWLDLRLSLDETVPGPRLFYARFEAPSS